MGALARLNAILLAVVMSPLAVGGDFYECLSPQGVKSYQTKPCETGAQERLRRGETSPKTVSLGGEGTRRTTQVHKAGRNYEGVGSINGQSFRMLVDTGASYVSLGREQALAAGLPTSGRPVRMRTANGVVDGYLTTARTVEFAGHRLNEVAVVVNGSQQPMPQVLLGMSFLDRFDLNLNGTVLSLTPK